MSAQPSISVITPMKNSEDFVANALKTVLTQSVKPTEILVIDDGSTDTSRAIVASLAEKNSTIKILDGPQRGPGPARNVGLRAATGDMIAFLDSDDLWPVNKLKMHMDRFDREPHIDVASGFVNYFKHSEKIGVEPAPETIIDEMFHVHLGATLYRASVFDQLGHFDENFLYSEDVDLMLRIRESDFKMTILNEVTLFYRRHDNSMTSKYTFEEKRDFNRALMRSLMRRKKTGKLKELTPFRDLVGY